MFNKHTCFDLSAYLCLTDPRMLKKDSHDHRNNCNLMNVDDPQQVRKGKRKRHSRKNPSDSGSCSSSAEDPKSPPPS